MLAYELMERWKTLKNVELELFSTSPTVEKKINLNYLVLYQTFFIYF